MDTVIAVSFAEPSKAYEALAKLKELDQQGQIELYEGGVVERDATGQLIVKDRIDDPDEDADVATASGGLIGLLVGVVADPVGMLLGGSVGLLTGAIVDLGFEEEDHEDNDSVLGAFARRLRAGQTAVLARLDEPSYAVVDSAMGSLGGNVLRRPSADVEAELAAARDKAEREARKKLRKERHKAKKKEIDAKLDALRAKVHNHSASPKDAKTPATG